jgi:hypothetical protein
LSGVNNRSPQNRRRLADQIRGSRRNFGRNLWGGGAEGDRTPRCAQRRETRCTLTRSKTPSDNTIFSAFDGCASALPVA